MLLAYQEGVAQTVQDFPELDAFAEGQRIDIPDPYHRATWELLRKVVTDISDAASAKVS